MPATTDSPNVIVILTDDQGYGDLSCMGSEDIRTPHMDALAASGVRFTDWYANGPVCSPTRASLLTGRYPGNAGVRSILQGHRRATGLFPEVPTFARALKQRGYRTAMFGKWHLGLADGCRPNDHGFDEFVGFLAGCVDYYSHIFYWSRSHDPLHDLWHNREELWRNGDYMTELITSEAVRCIRAAARQGSPFCLYVAYNAPHYPMHAPAEYMDRFTHLPWDRRVMAAMLSCVDDGVGRIRAELERQGAAENTIITFQSDNGPSRESRNWLDGTVDPYYGGSSGGFRGHKFSLFEGGVRVPGIVSYPATIPAGQVCSTPGASMDVFPTILEAAGGNPGDYELDGVSLLGHLRGEAPPSRDLFFEQGDQTAVRRGDWKLTLNGRPEEGAGPIDDVFLADLVADPGERTNLAATRRDVRDALQAAAQTWRAGLEERWENRWRPRHDANLLT